MRGVARMKRFLRLPRTPTKDQDGKPQRLSKKAFPAGLKLLYSPKDGKIELDIVFVHGLTGDREATWAARGATEPWPKTLLPTMLPTARVLTFGYGAYVADWRGVVSQSLITNYAWNLLTSLASYRENDRTVGQTIISDVSNPYSRQDNDRNHISTKFFVPPSVSSFSEHRITELVLLNGLKSFRSFGLIKKTNPDILEVLRRDSEALARIQDGFHTMIKARYLVEPPPIEATCFYEELPVHGFGLVVPQDSAILPGYIPIGIHSNHMDMTKFANVDDPGFVAICGELRRWIRETVANKKRQTNPSLVEQPSLEAHQYGHNNRQHNHFGEGAQKIVDGHYFEAHGNQTFGMVPPKETS